VADVRIDNRSELASGLDLNDGAGLSDPELLLRSYERWGAGLLDRLSGDFAFAVWDRRRQEFLLARDPTGQRPLHFYRDDGLFAFASMPKALFACHKVPAELDPRRMAELVADLRLPPQASYYQSISRVPSGHVLTVTRRGASMRRYWNPPLRTLALKREDDYVDAFRERLDHAVRARLRGTHQLVATHLTAGYDSSAVTATAARLMRHSGGRVLAFTAAPRQGYSGDMQRGRVADESPYAAMTARLYSNVEHRIVRSDARSPLALLDRSHKFAQYPVGQLSNNRYWTSINRLARESGASVLLTGQAGNFGLSAGNLWSLADLIRDGRWGDWAREARLLAKTGPARWTGILANSFGPWLPRPAWLFLNAATRGASLKVQTPHLLHPDWGRQIDNSFNPGRDTVPPRDSYRFRLELVQALDPGAFRKASLADHGIEERDPTADRQLLEFCFSLPPEQLLRRGKARPLARAALSDRLPVDILETAPRGYQMADWYETLDREEIAVAIEMTAADPMASSIINVPRLRHMFENWPRGGWNSIRIVQEYRFHFLIALSVSHFIRSFDPTPERNIGGDGVALETIP
jgi:asparagine synthase (glutamine-hydrolysing)